MTTPCPYSNQCSTEEDSSPYYRKTHYYPARIGQDINQYRIISKLGWGTNSTVWLAKKNQKWPWQSDRYVALKILTASPDNARTVSEELQVSQRITATHSNAEGCSYLRIVQEHFSVDGPHGKHLVLAFEPLREPIWMLGRRLGRSGIPLDLLKSYLKIILKGLALVHSCGIIHTDLKADNFLLVFEDDSVIRQFAIRQQRSNSVPLSEVDGHVVYRSQGDFGPLQKTIGRLKISDFGSAVLGVQSELYFHDIQPEGLEAPEVLLKAGWNCSADIWNLGVVLWEFLQDEPLALGRDLGSGKYSRAAHIAQLHKLLGPLPETLRLRADKGIIAKLYRPDGQLKHSDLVPSDTFNLKSLTHSLAEYDKGPFLEFASKMLRWIPEERATAEDLYNDPWLDKESKN